MTQTNTSTEAQLAAGWDLAPDPGDFLMNLIVTFLAPMFLCVTGGNINHARMAATRTIDAYRATSHADLISIAQIIAFGLAALSSLSQSMSDDISLTMALRLRGNANALNRSAEQNRCALLPSRRTDGPTAAEPETDNAGNDTGDRAAMQQSDAPAPVPPQADQDLDNPASPPATSIAQLKAEKRHQTMWAIAMVKEAAEIIASIPGLPLIERRAASIRAALLGSTANELLTGASSPSRGHTP